MTNTDKPYITPTHQTAESPDESTYIVAVNDQGQHAVWPAELVLPAGWRQRSAAMPKQDCLAAVAAAWQDIAPASVRRAEQAPGPEQAPEGRRATFMTCSLSKPLAGLSRSPSSRARSQLTYGQLDRSANKLAHHLQGMGVGPETLVGVCLERGAEAVRCLLAIMKAGGAYLPLDPSLPAARLARMCAEARPTVILVSRADAGAFGETDARLLAIDELAADARGPAGHGARGQPARGKPLLRHLHLGLHRPAEGGRRQPRLPGLRHQRAIPGIPDCRPGPGAAARLRSALTRRSSRYS